MLDVRPIPTRYAGCHFRSRLEARWAVFFDQLGIQWEYELEGFEVGPEHDRRNYLPDFWLPGENCWAEIKSGSPDFEDIVKMHYGCIPDYGLPGNKHGVRLLLLGSIPNPNVLDSVWHHTIVYNTYTHDCVPHLSPGLYTRCAVFGKADKVAYDEFNGPNRFLAYPEHWGIKMSEGPTCHTSAWDFSAFISEGYLDVKSAAHRPCSPEVRQAYMAARSARFEHGHSGAS
jgi:hypothetical protein